MTPPTCAGCSCFRLFYGEKQGECWGSLPQMQTSGNQVDRPTVVKLSRPACASYRALPEGVETLFKGKVSPETSGDAVKLARKDGLIATFTPPTILVTETPLPPAPAAVIQQVDQRPPPQRKRR